MPSHPPPRPARSHMHPEPVCHRYTEFSVASEEERVSGAAGVDSGCGLGSNVLLTTSPMPLASMRSNSMFCGTPPL